MKGNKKILVAIAMMLFTVVFTSYAIYRSSATGNGTLKAANWVVTVDGSSIESVSLDFDISDIDWTSGVHMGKNNTIAPGDTGTITIPVDATGSEVDVLLTAELGDITGLPDGMTVTVNGTNGVQEIEYNASSMTANVVLTVTWAGALTDNSTKDGTDKTAAGSNLTIPVTLTARQKLSTD